MDYGKVSISEVEFKINQLKFGLNFKMNGLKRRKEKHCLVYYGLDFIHFY